MSKKKKNKVEEGQKVSVHYTGTLEDGTEFDSSHPRGEPLTFEVGSGLLIEGFDNAVRQMSVGETKKIKLTPEQAYGEEDPELFKTITKAEFPEGYEFDVGQLVHGNNQDGTPVVATIAEVHDNDETVLLNFNHPMAGKILNFDIELVSVE